VPTDDSSAQTLDIGKRASDVINLHLIGGNVGKWVALRLSDGSSDGIPYDSRREAIEHQLHEQLCCYVRVPLTGMPPEHALRFIQLNRALYEAGYRIADPDMPGEPIYPERLEDILPWIIGRAN